jgi:branched-subunit amino acid transport protein
MEKRLALIFLMALGNALTRMIPVRLLSTRKLSPLFVTWLKYIPVPVLSAMLTSDLLIHDGKIDVSVSNVFLVVALPSFMVAQWTKNLFKTVLFGMALLALVRWGIR